MDLLQAVGNTSIVALRKVVPANCAKIPAKLEWENPAGSLKDRMANAVISRAEETGRLKRGDRVVEYTGGSTGTSLAMVCAARGYRLQIVSSDAFSREKLDHMAALGAELTLVPSEGGRTTRTLIVDMIEAARALSQKPGTYWTDQLHNEDSLTGYSSLGEEIWQQTDGKVDAFVHCVGTAASLRGVATVLKRHTPSVRIVAVEPAESSVLRGGQAGPHDLARTTEPGRQGIQRVPQILGGAGRPCASFSGTSSGANVVAAIQVSERLGPAGTVVTLMADSGPKYLSTDVYGRR